MSDEVVICNSMRLQSACKGVYPSTGAEFRALMLPRRRWKFSAVALSDVAPDDDQLVSIFCRYMVFDLVVRTFQLATR